MMSKAATMRKLLVFSAASTFLAGNVLARERAPDNLGVDRAARHIGNQRDLSRNFRRCDIGQFGGGRQIGGGDGRFRRR